MVRYFYFNTLERQHISTGQEIGHPNFSFTLHYDDSDFSYDEHELISILNYLRNCHHSLSGLIPPSIESINKFAHLFSDKFDDLTFYILMQRPEFLSVFYPHLNDFYIFYDKGQNTYGISSSPRFAETNAHCIVSIIPNLSSLTNPRDLRTSLNFIKLRIAPDTPLSREQIEHQISLFPELFAI